MVGTVPPADSQQSYISGEVTYLTSPGFANTVAKQLNVADPPRLSALQGVQSSVIGVSATNTDPAEAKREVDAALDVYRDHLQQQARERGQAAIDAIDGVPRRLNTATQPVAGGQTEPAPADEQAIQQLVGQRLAIEAQTYRAASVEVLQPSTVTSAAGAPGWTLGAVGGGLVGGLLALSGALAWRKRTGLTTSPSALETHIEHVLSPTVRIGQLTEASNEYAGLSRSLYAQLPSRGQAEFCSLERRTTLVPETSPGSSPSPLRSTKTSRRKALGIPYASPIRRRGTWRHPNELRSLTAVLCRRHQSCWKPPRTPARSSSWSTIGHDVIDAVRVARQLARNSDVPVSAVCTRGRSWRAGKNGKDHVTKHSSNSVDASNASSHASATLAH